MPAALNPVRRRPFGADAGDAVENDYLIHASEIALYDDYPVVDTMMDAMVSGARWTTCPAGLPGTIAFQWGPGLRLIAHGLGLQIDEIRENLTGSPPTAIYTWHSARRRPAPAVPCARRRIAVIDGREAITIEHVNRLAPDLGLGMGRGNDKAGLSDSDRGRAGYRLRHDCKPA